MKYFLFFFISLFSLNSFSQTTINKQKIDLVDEIVTYYSSTPSYGLTHPIFPDTNVALKLASSTISPWLHGVAQTFDLGGELLTYYGGGARQGGIFDPGFNPFDATANYTVDSISIACLYNRVDTTVVDTAIVSIIAKNNGNYKRTFVHRGQNLFYIDDVDQDNIPDSSIWRIKVPLDSSFKADTVIGGINYIKLSPGLTIANSEGIMGVTLEYKPGKTYSKLDTLLHNMNSISVWYSSPFGASSPYTYFNSSFVERSIGSFCDSTTKYSTAGMAKYTPTASFLPEHSYQFYEIDLFVSQQNRLTSTKEHLSSDFSLSNYPNPCSTATTIRYYLEEKSLVNLEIMDVSGKLVYFSELKKMTAGNHEIEVSTTEFKSGVYFYSLLVGETKVTKKMIVAN